MYFDKTKLLKKYFAIKKINAENSPSYRYTYKKAD